MKKKIAILFGGDSPEHDVSVITGLQVVEQIDREKYEVYPIHLTKNNVFKYHANVENRKGFNVHAGTMVNFGKDNDGPFLKGEGPFANKIRINAVYLAFHGGSGESGPMQGFFETLSIPYTSPSVETSVLAMNKAVTKEVLAAHSLPVIRGIALTSQEIKNSLEGAMAKVEKTVGLPVIIKPVHLGSSIGINIARTKVELKKFLLEASHVDHEAVVEKLMTNFVEYNCSVRSVNDKIETSEVERPISSDVILSFADKYQRGGNKKQSGMASLARELPAKMPASLKNKIQDMAREAFVALRAKGMLRIDFMVIGKDEIYITEVNPIPGSMAFYLWEASGITFTEQITDLIEQSIKDHEEKEGLRLDYESDIIEKFVKNTQDD